MKIAYLVPTRSRPKGLSRAVASLRGEATAYIGVDTTDPVPFEVPAVEAKVVKFGDDPTTWKWNMLAREAVRDGFDILILGSDDAAFEADDWAHKLRSLMSFHEDGIMCVGFNDGRSPGAVPHYAVTRQWVKALGYFCPPVFHHWCVDTWTAAVAKEIGRHSYAVDIMLRHHTVKVTGGADETHSRIRRGCWWSRDMEIERAIGERYRAADVEALRRVMR